MFLKWKYFEVLKSISGQKKNSEETFIKILLEKQIEKHTTAHSISPACFSQTFYTTVIKVQKLHFFVTGIKCLHVFIIVLLQF